ncbi:MAG: hypothetical protein RLZZ400_448, partial [Actinomycetota bacterium]
RQWRLETTEQEFQTRCLEWLCVLHSLAINFDANHSSTRVHLAHAREQLDRCNRGCAEAQVDEYASWFSNYWQRDDVAIHTAKTIGIRRATGDFADGFLCCHHSRLAKWPRLNLRHG